MKLKYYLRGLGMGIIFATIILSISGAVHNNNISEEKIIEEAKKLGMIMPEESTENKGGLWNKNDATEEMAENEDVDTIEDADTTEQIDTSETESSSTESDEPQTEEVKKDGERVAGENGTTYIVIHVYSGDTARIVAERLYDNKLVDDAEAFRKYLGQTGRAASLSVGEFLIPVDATYEQIFDVLMGR